MQSSDLVALAGVVVAFAGVFIGLIGALIGPLVRFWIEQHEWEREDRYRYNQVRRETYAEFLGTASNISQWQSLYPLDSDDPDIPVPEEYLSATLKFMTNFYQVDLIATDPVRETARRLFLVFSWDVAPREERERYDFPQDLQEGIREKGQRGEFAAEMVRFVEAARTELDIPPAG